VCREITQSRNPGAKRSIWDSIRPVMSTIDPRGTWQYAQAVCLPCGARDASNRLCCARRTYGVSGHLPFATASSPAAISSAHPPRWSVPARRHALAFHGIGEFKASSGHDAAAERCQVSGQGVGQFLRTSFRHRPSSRMPEHSQQEPGCCSGSTVERHVGMSGNARKQTPSVGRFEMPVNESLRRLNGFHSEAHQSPRMTRQMRRWRENFGD